MTNQSDELITVELQPFRHQVSGCHIILEISDASIINVKCNRYKDGIRFHGDIPKTIAEKTKNISFPYVLNSKHDNNKRLKNFQEKNLNDCIERYFRSYSDSSPQKFMILSNLLRSYQRPCVIDIKLGKQQRGRYHTEANRQKHEDRCACSTSSTLGFRINGTQVYKMDHDIYIRHDKFYGRKLDVKGVEKELHFFFHNGFLLSKNVIQTIIEKLKSLQYVLTNQRTFHLYACSLLLLYDSQTCNSSLINEKVMEINNDESGYPENSESPDCSIDAKADVKLIDFAHAIQRDCTSGDTNENDLDLINGLQNLIEILEHLR
ncbi:hypothetical protein KUTeg_008768 [Tegillarca granosa]|uniref:Kinase n=1 Tax=Tegillarca granosa TaxID=220873 RepID=A0ABQ9FCN6_TEGGR|nr:hypothetical protein KUTeg_008768 [Tegillarca granosa]